MRESPAPSASSAPSAPPSAASSAAPEAPLRFEKPIAATLRQGEILLAGARRGGDGASLVITRRAIEGGVVRAIDGPPLAEGATVTDVDWVGGAGALALVVDTGASVQALFAPDVAALGAEKWRPSDAGACVAGDRLLTLGRADGGFAVSALATSGVQESYPVPLGLSSSLACGAREAAVLVEDGGRRIGRRIGGKEDVPLALDDEERGFTLVPAGEAFLAVRLGARGLAFRTLGVAAGPWIRSKLRVADDATLELAIATEDVVAVVLSRGAAAARDCPGDEVDAIAELVVVDRASGALRRDAERLDRWTCGANPGPFFGGAAGDKIVVSWPRGASAACAKLGVRWGGVAWVTTTGVAPIKVARVDAPAEALADAGCDEARCALVALSRGRDGACLPASDPDAGDVRVISLAPLSARS